MRIKKKPPGSASISWAINRMGSSRPSGARKKKFLSIALSLLTRPLEEPSINVQQEKPLELTGLLKNLIASISRHLQRQEPIISRQAAHDRRYFLSLRKYMTEQPTSA